MSYEQNDISVSDGLPIEAFKFTGTFGTLRYTNNAEPVTVNGEVYTPLNITRSSIEVTSVADSIVTVDIDIPPISDIAVLYSFDKSPRDLVCEIRRVYRGDDFATEWRLVWTGRGMDASTVGDYSTIATGSNIQFALNGGMSTVTYQRTCNHALYDARCKVSKPAFTTSAVITKIQLNTITVDNTGVADNLLNAGEMILLRTGETQSIINNLGTIVKVGFPFFDLVTGDSVDLVQGCDHAMLGDCKVRYDNVENFGGFLYIPTTNPFENQV